MIPGVKLNAVMAGGGGGGRGGAGAAPSDFQWMPDGKGLLVEVIKPNRGAPPAEEIVPEGPHVQESLGRRDRIPRPSKTCFQNPHDEDLFEYYATCRSWRWWIWRPIR